MEPLKSVAVFGLGALGLAVIQAAKKAGASDIVGVDINESKFEAAKSMGADHFVNPMKGENGGKDELLGRHKWGYDYTFDCTGNVNVMRSALEVRTSCTIVSSDGWIVYPESSAEKGGKCPSDLVGKSH